MTTNQGETGRPEDQGQGKAKHSAFELLKDDEDRDVVRLWRESFSLLDGRYHSKALLQAVVFAMTDEQIRSRLINDTEGSLIGDQSSIDLPEGTTVRFFENTQNTLNVVLPPPTGGMSYSRSGEMTYRPPELREALRSRTSSAERNPFWKDDYDFGDSDFSWFFGDPIGRDPDTRDGISSTLPV